MNTRITALRPLRDLLRRLPTLPVSASKEVDYPAADTSLLVAIADDSQAVIQVIQQGIGSVGQLLSHSAPVIEDGTIGSDSLEHIGYLMAELADMATALSALSARCRQHTMDWSCNQPTTPCPCQRTSSV
jgi:hypothetical protein